jgi:hypothetical protein
MNIRMGNDNFDCAVMCGFKRFTPHKYALLYHHHADSSNVCVNCFESECSYKSCNFLPDYLNQTNHKRHLHYRSRTEILDRLQKSTHTQYAKPNTDFSYCAATSGLGSYACFNRAKL